MFKDKNKIGYLNSRYSAFSHTFIHREVRALRSLGAQIDTYTVRPANIEDLVSLQSKIEAKETKIILAGVLELFKDALLTFFAFPLNTLRACIYAQVIATTGLKNRALYFIYFLESLRFVRLLHDADILHVHVHMANNSATISLIAKKVNPKLSYSLSIHGPAEFNNIDQGRLKLKVEQAVFVRCISEFCRSQLMSIISTEHWDKLEVVHCAVEQNPLQFKKNESTKTRLLFVGRLVPEKGPLLLIKALENVVEKHKEWNLTVVGAGELERELKERVSAGLLSRHVKFLGSKSPEEVSSIMGQSDVLLLPSFMEGVPVVLMEAMSSNLLVVSTRIAGIPELIIDKETGLLLTPGSQKEMESCLTSILTKQIDTAKMKTQGYKKVRSEFDLFTETKKLMALFIKYRLIVDDQTQISVKNNAA